MIEKILDLYFSKKAVKLMLQRIKTVRIEVKVEKTKRKYIIFVKKFKEKEEYFKAFYDFYFEEGLETYFHFQNLTSENIINRVHNILDKGE